MSKTSRINLRLENKRWKEEGVSHWRGEERRGRVKQQPGKGASLCAGTGPAPGPPPLDRPRRDRPRRDPSGSGLLPRLVALTCCFEPTPWTWTWM